MTWRQIIPGVYNLMPNKSLSSLEVDRKAGMPGEDETELERRIKLSNIPLVTMETHCFSTWQHKSDEVWWPSVERYAKGDYDHPFLTFLGTVGTGKTHISLSLAWAWLERGKVVLYYQVENLLDALRRGYSSWQKGDPEGYQTILNFTQNTSLLILDDLGAQQETEWATSKLDQIIDYRYINKKPLIATTNLALKQLPARIADRLSEGALIHLKGESFRKQKQAKVG